MLKDLEQIPSNRRTAYALIDQVIRSLGSVGANIAEGFNRSKSKYLSALDIALGSARSARLTNETENWLYKRRDAGFVSAEKMKPHIRETIEIGKMLGGLIRSIRRQPDRRNGRKSKP